MTHPSSTINFGNPKGQLRHRLHSSNFMPNVSLQHVRDFTGEFAKMHFHEARTHDQALANPGQRVVDTHFVFPHMRNDPADPESYYFAATDHLLETCRACGTGIMYRLGTSIEHTLGRHFNALMPTDFEKYAEVLAGIIRHYNHGWADGFHWGITYWEIWCEADLGIKFWDGTLDDYYRFYAVVAKRLKREFPEIKVGGPSFCNFKEHRYTDFLTSCRDNDAPIDFLSWHCYTADAANLIAQPARARQLLDSLGFAETETMINEWHYLLSWEGVQINVTAEDYEKNMNGPAGMFGIDSAAFNITMITGWHDTPLDSAYYYGCSEGTWGFLTLGKALNKNYYSMCLVGEMMTRFPIRVEANGGSDTISVLAGTDANGNCGILVADYRGEGMEIPLTLNGVGEITDLTITRLDNSSNLEKAESTISGSHLVLRKQEPGSAAFLITFQNN